MAPCGLVASYIFVQAQTLEEGEGGKGKVHLFPYDYVFIQKELISFVFLLICFLLFWNFLQEPVSEMTAAFKIRDWVSLWNAILFWKHTYHLSKIIVLWKQKNSLLSLLYIYAYFILNKKEFFSSLAK